MRSKRERAKDNAEAQRALRFAERAATCWTAEILRFAQGDDALSPGCGKATFFDVSG